MKNLRKLFFCTGLCMAFAFGLFIADANSQASIPPATEIGGGDGGGGDQYCHHNHNFNMGGGTNFCLNHDCSYLPNAKGSTFAVCR